MARVAVGQTDIRATPHEDEAGCLAHARRKFHELWANHRSTLAEQALALFARLYEVEREVAD